MKRSMWLPLIALLAGSTMSIGAANAAAPEEATSTPLEECIAEHHSLSVLFLVDTSGSLRDTDSDNQRVTGLQLAVAALASQRGAEESKGNQFPVYVDFLSFGETTRRSFNELDWPTWGDLPVDATALIDRMGAFKQANKDSNTDYVSALQPYPLNGQPVPDQVGALDHLKAAPTGTCRLLVWFTDGQLDFDPPGKGGLAELSWLPGVRIRNENDASRAAELGRARLCDEGLVDRLRAGGIDSGEGAQLAVVALGEDATKFDLINSIATGGCGGGTPRGAVYPADNVNDLIFSLQQAVVGEGDGPKDDELNTCVGSGCANVDPAKVETFDYPFTLTAGMSSFNLVALEGDPGISSVLIAPDGQQVSLDEVAGEQTMTNGTVLRITPFTASPAVHLLRAELGDDPNQWAGQWRVRFSASSPSAANKINRAALYVFAGDLEVRLRNPEDVLRRKRTGTIVLELVAGPSRKLITRPEAMPTTELSLTIDGEPVETGDIHPDGSWEISYPVAEDFPNDSVEIKGNLAVKVQIDPSLPVVVLEEWPVDGIPAIEVRDLPKYPLLDGPISPFAETLSQQRTSVRSTLKVEAPDLESGGCVTLTGVDQPHDDADLSGTVRVFDGTREVKVGAECAISVAAGDARELTIEVSMSKGDITTNAALVGELTFRSVSDVDPSESGEFTKTIAASVVPIFNTDIDWMQVILLTVAALLLALLVLYGLNFFGAKLDVGPGAFVSIPVRYSPGLLQRRKDGTAMPFKVDDEDIDVVGMPMPGRYRSVDLGGVKFSRRLSWSPFADVAGAAKASGRSLVVANDGTTTKGDTGLLSASLTGAWVFQADAPPQREGDRYEPVDGTITMVLPTDPTLARSKVAEHLSTIQDRIGDVCAARAVEPPPPPAAGQVDVDVTSALDTPTAPFADPLTGSVPIVPPAPHNVDPFGGPSLPTAPDLSSDDDGGKKRRLGRKRGNDQRDDTGPSIQPPDLPF